MNLAILFSLALSLFLTIVLELGFFILVGKLFSGTLFTGKREKKDYLLVVLVNVLTNPLVVLSYWLTVLYTNWPAPLVLIPLELFAILAEGFYYKKYGAFSRPYLFSTAANVFSFGTGLLIQLLY